MSRSTPRLPYEALSGALIALNERGCARVQRLPRVEGCSQNPLGVPAGHRQGASTHMTFQEQQQPPGSVGSFDTDGRTSPAVISSPPSHFTRDLELEALETAVRWPQPAP